MPLFESKTDRDALRLMKSAFIVAGAAVCLHQVGRGHPLSLVWLAAGLFAAFLTWLVPSLFLPVARPIHRVLIAFGELVSNVLLSVIYFCVVWPWHWILRATRRIEQPSEEWPPRNQSAWRPVDVTSMGVTRRARAGSWLAGLLMQVGAGVALLRYVYQRPSAFVVPVLVLLLLLAAVVLLGNTTGLGPLVYTLF